MADKNHYKDGVLRKKIYEAELKKLQTELIKLQHWVHTNGLQVCVLFEGRDAAGKGGVIKRISGVCNPRIVRVVALDKPTKRNKTEWYYKRYVNQLPREGEITLFDRSWYNRAGVEKVMGFCSDEEYQTFLKTCPQFENLLIDSGIILIKYWFSIGDKEQKRRFLTRNEDPLKRWKLSPMDLEARTRWVDYSKAKDQMFEATDTAKSPWYVVNADIKKHARLNCINHLLNQIEYEDLTPDPIELPPVIKDPDYVRPSIKDQNWIPAIYGTNPIDDLRS